jgi:hypothetical protein
MCNEFRSAWRRIVIRRACLGLAGLTQMAMLGLAAQAAGVSTATTLTLSSGTVASPAAVTLTATVTAGGSAVTAGTVTFCDASAAECQNTSIVGTGQINGNAAIIKIVPAIGVHTYKAIFNGTVTNAGSTSSTQTLTVSGQYPTSTSIAVSGSPSGYGLTATVVGVAGHPPLLSGTVSFQDTSNNDYVLGVGTLGAPAFAQSFIQPTGSPVPTGNQPSSVAAADFNNDGKPDFAVMASQSNAIYVMLGNGDGTFTAAPGSPIAGVGTIPCVNNLATSNCSLTVADFNHDGNMDLAETSGYDNEVLVYLGQGNGSFVQATGSPITVGNFPQAVRTGDFNRDGLVDMAVANANDNTVSILLGNGDGTFTPATNSPVPVGGFPFFLAVADFNNDGSLDIAVGNQADSTVTILLGNGDGTFAQAPGSPVPGFNYNPGELVAADFNGDGRVDLAATNFTPVPPSTVGSVTVVLGNGDGTFAAAPGSPIAVGVDPFALVAGDFNEDGITDLAVANYGLITNPPTQTLQLLLGKGDGTFTSSGTPTQLADSPNEMAVADFNGDGAPDLAIVNIADFDTTILLDHLTQTETASVTGITIAGSGTHYVDAVYPGSTYFAPSTSNTVPLQGMTVPSTLTLTASTLQQLYSLPVILTAQVATAANPPPPQGPTGTVSFFDNGTLLGTSAVNAAGQAIYITTSLADGAQSITASYSGDPSYTSSTAGPITVTISDLQIARKGNGDTTVLPGTTVVYTMQVTPEVINSFLYNVTFTTSGLPEGANATFSPVSLAGGSSAAAVTMTVTTSKSALNEPPPGPFERLPLALGILLPLCGAFRTRRRFLGIMLVGIISLAAIVGLNGCSGAGLFAARKVPYSITVIANEGNASGTLQRSTQVPLAIQ